MTISLILAIGKNNELGKNNKLLWHLPKDMNYFKDTTRGHTVIMGRKTYESIGKALPNRKNIVLTKNINAEKSNIFTAQSLEQAFKIAKEDGEVFVIGGAHVYEQALPYADTLYITHVDGSFEADTFFPLIDTNIWQKTKEETYAPDIQNSHAMTFVVYKKLCNL